jgi:subtilase family serine protease
VRLAATLENQGSRDVPPTRLWLFVAGDLLDDVQVPAIPAGRQVTVNATVAFDQAGTHLVVVQADGEGAVEEMAKDNNGIAQAIDIAPPSVFSKDFVQAPAPAGLALLAVLLLLAARRRGRA